MIFALFLAFHAADIWSHKRSAERAFIQAGSAIKRFIELTSPAQMNVPEAATAVRRYVLAVKEDEWTHHRNQKASSKAEAALRDLQALTVRMARDTPGPAASQAFALVEGLGLTDYDLVGFSLGSRTAARGVIAGLDPRRLVLAGMGLEGLAGWTRRSAFFLDAIARFDEVKHGDAAFMAVAFMKTQKVDLVAAKLLLESVGDTDAADLAKIAMPTMVLCGAQDRDNGDPAALTAALPDAVQAVDAVADQQTGVVDQHIQITDLGAHALGQRGGGRGVAHVQRKGPAFTAGLAHQFQGFC